MSVDELKAKLTTVTDPDEYDRLSAEILAAEKAATLQANQERVAAREAAEAEHTEKLKAHKSGLRKREKLLEALAKEDQAIFDALQELHARYLSRYDGEIELHRLTTDLNFSARDLDEHPIEGRPITVCNTDVHGLRSAFDGFELLVRQFNQAAGHLVDAAKKNVPGPEKVGLDWFNKGDGRFWPKK